VALRIRRLRGAIACPVAAILLNCISAAGISEGRLRVSSYFFYQLSLSLLSLSLEEFKRLTTKVPAEACRKTRIV
jgi:hypothetical protein